ncbi:hypothetical protein V1477_011004, partial [Vespula maculifrons]
MTHTQAHNAKNTIKNLSRLWCSSSDGCGCGCGYGYVVRVLTTPLVGDRGGFPSGNQKFDTTSRNEKSFEKQIEVQPKYTP